MNLIYNGYMRKFPFINDNKWKVIISTRWHSLKHSKVGTIKKDIIMNKRIFLISILIFSISLFIYGQNDENYYKIRDEAYNLYKAKNYCLASKKYERAFNSPDIKISYVDYYNAACSYALCGNIDTAFYYLSIVVKEYNFSYYNHFVSDSDLIILHNDTRWESLTNIVKENNIKKDKLLDKDLILILDSIRKDDQSLRLRQIEYEKIYGVKSEEADRLNDSIIKQDSINLIKIERILDEHGWLGSKFIGENGNLTLFLVIQHSNLKTQEKYLPMLREAVKKGNALPNQLALLEDRVLIGNGEKQIYGSQLQYSKDEQNYIVSPMIDPENVDRRRASMGLEPMSEYLKFWNLTWDIENYNRQIKKIEKKYK